MRISRSRGFTLIEVMMAVVVVAILAAIAYPSYQEHVAKSRRAEGKSALLKAAQVQERFFTDKNRYATLAELAPASGVTSGTTIYSGENPNVPSYYTITLTPATPTTTFTLTAEPNPTTFPDPKCGNFTLTNTGLRGWSSGTNPNLCRW
jgi:type IV pilus assembly protein PilE